MEEYKLLYEFEKNTRYYLKGDKIFVSNKGNVKLNDMQLTLGNGLWLKGNRDKGYCLSIIGFTKYSVKNLYRSIYYLFTGKCSNKCNVNIHHIDYDITNNSLDNLIMLSSREHGKLHNQDNIKGSEGNIKLQHKYEIINRYINISNDNYISFLEQRKQNALKEQQEQKRKELEQKEQKQQKQKEQKAAAQQKIIEEKLASGLYKYNANGKLYKYKRPEQSQKMLSKWADNDYKTKLSNSMKEKWEDDEYRQKVSQSVSEAVTRLWQDDEYRQRVSNCIKKLWKDGVYRTAHR